MRPATVGELNCVMTEVLDRRRITRIGVLGAAAFASALAVASFLWATQGGILASLGRELPLGAVVVAMAGLIQVSVAAWMVANRHPMASIGLAVLGAAVTLPWWAVWTALPDPVSAKLLALAPLAVAGTAQVALRWTADRPPSPMLTWVYIMTAAAALTLFVGYNPFDDPGCGWVCVDVPAPVLSTRGSVLVTAVITTLAAGMVVRTLIKARPRLGSGLLGGAVMVSLGLLVGHWVIRWANWGEQSGEALILPFVAQALIGGAVVIVTLRSMNTRDAVTRTISRLNEAETVLGDMESTLAGVQFALPEGNGCH